MTKKDARKPAKVVEITSKHPGHMQLDGFMEKYKAGRVKNAVIIADMDGELFRIHVTDSERSTIMHYLWITLLEMGLEDVVDFEE